ncbi:uncharacterized protein LOC111399198 [Olea europaea var. sylvestris]|uniref:Uncharacterized protein n=2 Tax=Olea europaea subsp. europaea TaxID=158383 RepID=A0A8S0VGW7_OLEEU|nr:uncharacterized protein LOC111399198 [Olea europaea var. sylvestris]CAA3028550.1 Hypothetical predicted protein [Olea europaea subsp. europaea]
MSSLVYFLLCIYYLHACTGRPLAVSDQENSSQIQFSGKDMKTPGADKLVVQGNFRVEYGEKTIYSENTMKLKNQKIYMVKETEDLKGDEVKMTHFGKVFEDAATEKEGKREGRLTLESPSQKARKNTIFKKSNTIEDIVVMDYAQPRRKPPIHNKEP